MGNTTISERDKSRVRPTTTQEMSRRLESSKITPNSTSSVEPIKAKTGQRTRILWDTDLRRPSMIGQELQEKLSKRVDRRSSKKRPRRKRDSLSESSNKLRSLHNFSFQRN